MSFNLFGEREYQQYKRSLEEQDEQQQYQESLTPPGIIGSGGGGAPSAAIMHSENGAEGVEVGDHRALEVALELSKLGMSDASSFMMQGGGGGSGGGGGEGGGYAATSPSEDAQLRHSFLQSLMNSNHYYQNGGGAGGSMMPPPGLGYSPQESSYLYGMGLANMAGEDFRYLMPRKSPNLTECVPVPSCEHVAEIVGRQGCKIKALRAKTNTYIKTPIRGEEPVFVVTGRKDDVSAAKREIISAADHFSQIRASRSIANGGTSSPPELPGQITLQVRVPYRVVGLVVGPKGATIKRIQQQTKTYIVTPSRDKDPVFEVTGLPEHVNMAKTEIEAHIAIRTGSMPNDDQGQMLDQDDMTYSSDIISNLYKSGLFGSNGLGGLESLGFGLGAIGSLSSSLSSSQTDLGASAHGLGNGVVLNNAGSAGSSNSGGGSSSSLSSLHGFSSGLAVNSTSGIGAIGTSIANRLPIVTSQSGVYSQLSDMGFSFLDNTSRFDINGPNGLMSSSNSDDSYVFGGSGPNSMGGSQPKLSDLFAAIGTNNAAGFSGSIWGNFETDEGLGESPTPDTFTGPNFM